jgi:hypothetical protein
MGNVFTLENDQARDILNSAIGQRIPAIMSYMSRNKWHVAKVVMVARSDQDLHLETMQQDLRQQPLNIQVGQPVGLSFKYSYAKFVFDTLIQELMPSAVAGKGGAIVVALPDKVEASQRRSYFRVNVPTDMQVKVVIWHRTGRLHALEEPQTFVSGTLMDLSAGGAQIAVPMADMLADAERGQMTYRKGQFIGLRFTPLPYETPVVINAQIRTMIPTADETAVCMGLQLVGLEASIEGRQTLTRVADVVEKYHQLNNESTSGSPTELLAASSYSD